MTDYYFSAASGVWTNAGTSIEAPWHAFHMLKNVDLQPGDRILLEAGSVFDMPLVITDAWGTKALPITIGVYGDGPAPIIMQTGGAGLITARTEYFILDGVSIQSTEKAAIEGYSANNWTIRNVEIDDAGGMKTKYGAINWRDSHDIVVENTTITDTLGDSIYMTNMTNVVIRDNILDGVCGAEADNIQITGSHVLIENNAMRQGVDSDSTKGNVVFQGDHLYVHDNYLEGGSFGVGVSAEQTVIDGNVIVDHDRYDWSMGIGISDSTTGDVWDGLVITNNQLSGAPNGISFYGAAETVQSGDILTVNGLEISGNQFYDWANMAVKFTNTTANGDYSGNTYYQEYSELSNSYAESNVSSLTQGDNVFVDLSALPVPPPAKVITIEASGDNSKGAPIMQVFQNDILVFETEVYALKSKSQKAIFSFELNDYEVTDTLKIAFANDYFHFPTQTDRNLYVHDVRVDGQDVSFWSAETEGKAYYNKARTLLTYSSYGSISFDGQAAHLDAPLVLKSAAPAIDELLDFNGFVAGNADIGAKSAQSISPVFTPLEDSLQTLQTILGETLI